MHRPIVIAVGSLSLANRSVDWSSAETPWRFSNTEHRTQISGFVHERWVKAPYLSTSFATWPCFRVFKAVRPTVWAHLLLIFFSLFHCERLQVIKFLRFSPECVWMILDTHFVESEKVVLYILCDLSQNSSTISIYMSLVSFKKNLLFEPNCWLLLSHRVLAGRRRILLQWFGTHVFVRSCASQQKIHTLTLDTTVMVGNWTFSGFSCKRERNNNRPFRAEQKRFHPVNQAVVVE